MSREEKDFTEKWFNDKMKRVSIELLMGVFAILVLSFICFSDGIEKRNEYYEYKDIVVPVNATISDVYEIDEEEYSIAVSYKYNNEIYEDVHWMRTKTKYKMGDTVKIKVNPERPAYIFLEDNGTKDLILAGCIFVPSSAIIIAVIAHFGKKRRAKLEE